MTRAGTGSEEERISTMKTVRTISTRIAARHHRGDQTTAERDDQIRASESATGAQRPMMTTAEIAREGELARKRWKSARPRRRGATGTGAIGTVRTPEMCCHRHHLHPLLPPLRLGEGTISAATRPVGVSTSTGLFRRAEARTRLQEEVGGREDVRTADPTPARPAAATMMAEAPETTAARAAGLAGATQDPVAILVAAALPEGSEACATILKVSIKSLRRVLRIILFAIIICSLFLDCLFMLRWSSRSSSIYYYYFIIFPTERGVCVKGESCEYEHLGRPLVVDEAGLSKLQSDRGTLLLLSRLVSLSLSLLLTDPRPRLDQKTPRKPVPTIRRIRSSTRPAPSRCGTVPRPELRLPCHAVGGASPVPACSTRPCSPCRPCLTRRDWAIRVRHHHRVCSHGLSPRADD